MENRVRDALRHIDVTTLNAEECKTLRRMLYLSRKSDMGKPLIQKKKANIGEIRVDWDRLLEAFEDWVSVRYDYNKLSYNMARYRLMKDFDYVKSKHPKKFKNKSISIKRLHDGLLDIMLYDIDSAEVTPGLKQTQKRLKVQKIAMINLNQDEI